MLKWENKKSIIIINLQGKIFRHFHSHLSLVWSQQILWPMWVRPSRSIWISFSWLNSNPRYIIIWQRSHKPTPRYIIITWQRSHKPTACNDHRIVVLPRNDAPISLSVFCFNNYRQTWVAFVFTKNWVKETKKKKIQEKNNHETIRCIVDPPICIFSLFTLVMEGITRQILEKLLVCPSDRYKLMLKHFRRGYWLEMHISS